MPYYQIKEIRQLTAVIPPISHGAEGLNKCSTIKINKSQRTG